MKNNIKSTQLQISGQSKKKYQRQVCDETSKMCMPSLEQMITLIKSQRVFRKCYGDEHLPELYKVQPIKVFFHQIMVKIDGICDIETQMNFENSFTEQGR